MSYSPAFDQTDIEKNKTVSALAYILFFIPLVASPESKFGRFHANQGLLLLICSLACGILSRIPLLGWLIGTVLGLATLALIIYGIYYTIQGEAKQLPFIGHITLLR